MNKKDKIFFPIFILGFIVLSGILAYFQPLTDGLPTLACPPDEADRFLVPWYIYRYGSIPNAYNEEIRVQGYGVSYAIFNVFPYIVQGFVMRFASRFVGTKLALLYVGRAVNIFFGTVMATFVYKLSKLLFKDDAYRWLFNMLIVYLPQNIFIHSYINTDSCCLMAIAIMLYGLVSGIKKDFDLKSNVILSIGIIICALSYYNAYGFILSSILLFAGFFIKNRDIKGMLKKGSLVSVLVLSGISWWFIRSFILYGDILGFKTRDKMASMYAVDLVNPQLASTYKETGISIFEMLRTTTFISETLGSFVARFGSMTIGSSRYLYLVFYLIFIVGLVACVVIKRNSDSSINPVSSEPGYNAFVIGNLIFCIIMPVILLLYYAYAIDYQEQGRYILPALIPFIYFVVSGIVKLMEKLKLKGIVRLVIIIGVALYPVIANLWIIFHNALPLYMQVGMKL